MTHLALSLLGAFEATLDGAAITAFESARVRALLAYLAVEADRPHSREALAGFLWPDQPERQAHDNLRAALANLRTALHDRQAQPPFLLISRAALQFNVSSDYRLDVRDFESLISDAPTTLSTGFGFTSGESEPHQSTIQNLRSAIDLYRGPFLGGFSVPSIEFEAWQLLRQEQFESQFLAALQRLAALHEARGEYEPALACARRQLESVPWDEPAHRRLMHLLALSGRRGAALAQYETCRRVLAAEFGVEPAFETTALYERIREGRVSRPRELDPHIGGAPDVSGLARGQIEGQLKPLFVAREGELAALDGHLAQALVGQGRVVFVTGEAGSGKTALLAEFARRASAAHADLLVASGSGNEHLSQGDPYLPFREILQLLAGDVEAQRAGRTLPAEQARRLWDLLPVTVHALLTEGPDLVDRLLPGDALALRAEAFAPGGAAWRTRLEALLQERQSTVPQVSAALLKQTTQVLLTIARRRPLLLLLDNLQWADVGSLSLLFHLGRRLAQADSRLLVVGAYRPHDLLPLPDGTPHPLLSLVRELQREFGEIEVDLDQAAGRPFIDALLDAEPNTLGESFRASLNRATGGHALFTVELLRELRERGRLVRDETGRWVQDSALDWGRLPARVEAVIAARLDRLPANWLALLTAASVEGETFTAEVLAAVLGLDEAQVLGDLNGPLSRARLVHARDRAHLDNGQRLSHYRFRHALFQTYLFDRLNAVERAHLHEVVGTALEKLHGEGTAEVAAQLAWHFEAAGQAGKAVDYLLLAGQRAYLLSASEEAIALYRRALALLETWPASDERARCELDLYLALHASLLYVSDRGAPEQAAALAHAARLAQHLGEPARLLPVLHALYKLNVAQARHEQALTLAQQLLTLAEEAQEPAYLIVGYHLAGLSRFLLGKPGLGREEMEQSLALYRRRPAPELPSTGEPDVGVDILTWLSCILWMLGYPDQALARNREALARARQSAHTPTLVMVLGAAGIASHVFGRRFAAVRADTEWMQRLVLEKNLTAYQPWVSFYQGWLRVHQERAAEEGVAQMRASMPSVQAVRPYRLTLLAEACLLAGQIDAAWEALDEALALAVQSGARSGEAEMHRLRGELALAAQGKGSQAEAEACFQRAVEVARRQGAKSWELRATVSLARLWTVQGRTEEARARLTEVYGWFAEGFDTPDLIEARALLTALEQEVPDSDGLLFAGAT